MCVKYRLCLRVRGESLCVPIISNLHCTDVTKPCDALITDWEGIGKVVAQGVPHYVFHARNTMTVKQILPAEMDCIPIKKKRFLHISNTNLPPSSAK
jgi:hypothetical protein